MSEATHTSLRQLLFKNMDVFAWTPADMVGVPWHIAEHRLNVSENAKSFVQTKRNLGSEKHEAMKEQVTELLNAGIIREVHYQTWVSSPVMVPKGNAGWRMARYQRLMNETFGDAISKYIKVYMYDLVIMSKEEDLMLQNIQKTFDTLRGVNIKLNPVKCSFEMEEGKFLGFTVTKDGFKVNPDKVQAIEQMSSLSTVKEMQKLAAHLAALNRFKNKFSWTPEAELAFREVKECLIRLPTLTAPVKDEPLVMYLSALEKEVGAVLLVDRQGVQTPVYYVSCTLNDPETRYSIMEKLVLALIYASRRLRRYFGDHVIHVLTNYNIENILARPEISGRLAKWAIELGRHNVVFRPRPAIKGQVLVDFLTEVLDDKDRECKAMEKAETQSLEEPWLLYIDDASNEDGAGAGLRLINPEKHEFTYAIRLDFKSTNNEAEYEVFLVGLRLAIKMGVKHLEAHVDSLLVVGQINGQYDAKGYVMALYLEQAKTLLQTFNTFKIHHINKSKNKPADALSKLASTSFQHLAKDVSIEVLKNPSVPLRQVSVIQLGSSSWMTPIIMYLQSGILPENKVEAKKIQHKAMHYQMSDGILYRRSYLGPLLHCVDPEDANYLIREVHEGICGIHAGPRMVEAKVMNAGYYWPGMHLDAVKVLKKCNGCQRHAPKTLRPKNELVPVTTTWSFQQWGIDMVSPFLEALGAVKFIIVAVDYFAKWVEAKALASTTAMVVRRFIWNK
ncbi:uncharacterized protein LOC110933410 [Helianthus annuus]|uniref:uncharacterized protein LOC110933410 n=1 Tax=Helianthus annuus TaxID=4232 RepID=UPI000B8F38F4|nr:uncharacterized protein LOC110933410 [Helianthus annuus]